MKRTVCLFLALIAVVSFCSCGKTIDTNKAKAMISQMLSDFSDRKFEEVAENTADHNGTRVKAESIEPIYDWLVSHGVDPSLGITVDQYLGVYLTYGINRSSVQYSFDARCGDYIITFTVTVMQMKDDMFFSQILVNSLRSAAVTSG